MVEVLTDLLHLALGEVWLSQGKPKAALPYLEEALWSSRLLAEKDSDSLYTQRCLALTYRWLGECYAKLKDPAKAAEYLDQASAIWNRWKRENLAVEYASRKDAEVLRARAVHALK